VFGSQPGEYFRLRATNITQRTSTEAYKTLTLQRNVIKIITNPTNTNDIQ